MIKSLFTYLKKSKKATMAAGFKGFDGFCVWMDSLYCKLRFHCGFVEYFSYELMNKRDRYRKNYLNSYWRHKKYKKVKISDGRFARKLNQYDFFKNFVRRDYIRVDKVGVEGLAEFVETQEKVIFKPNYGSCGKGIFAFENGGDKSIVDIFAEISGQDYICEGYIKQHPVLNSLYEKSVNTLRILTLNDGNEVKILAATLRMGCKGNVCDNLSIAGIGASVDLESGVIFTFGKDFAGKKYVKHPDSGTQIIGVNIPFWKETAAIIKESAARLPQFGILGWDVAMTEDGPAFVEFNGTSGTMITQYFDGLPKGEEIIRYIKKNARRITKQRKQQQKQRKNA